MQRINETRHMIWHQTCKCICRLTASVCNKRQRFNEDTCRCECKKLIDKEICDKGFIWNPSTYDCECDKSCGIGEYLDYKNCVYKSSIIDRLIEDCTIAIDENKIYNETLNIISSDDCASCTLYVVLSTSVIIGGGLIYFYWYKKINN